MGGRPQHLRKVGGICTTGPPVPVCLNLIRPICARWGKAGSGASVIQSTSLLAREGRVPRERDPDNVMTMAAGAAQPER